ncbi:plasmid mobilization protein [Cerasicoccus frondis]|uniref:plasmid mobilization protein n=1 Tax=Cerasicoccus frondis TaxID=490090 RepID=UPI003CCCF9AE
MARPSLPQSRVKTRIVSFRLNDAEHARLAHKAASANMRINEFARRASLSGGGRISIRTVKQCDPALMKQLYHIGHNLNQLVKNAHIFERVSPQVDELCHRIDRLMDEALNEENDE